MAYTSMENKLLTGHFAFSQRILLELLNKPLTCIWENWYDSECSIYFGRE